MEYIYSMGHRRMDFVGHHSGLTLLLGRKKSFLNTMKQYSGEVEFATAANQDSPEGGQLAIRHFLDPGFKPTAVIAVNDFIAFGVLKQLRESGLQIPEDVSVTGRDNIRLSEFVYPSLTTVNIPRAEIGHTAFHARVPSDDEVHAVGLEFRINPELVIRETTGRLQSRGDLHQPDPALGTSMEGGTVRQALCGARIDRSARRISLRE